jgi:antitoxin (DNA-binding transcriptional repressor) of toxin-antitoxin stability system
MKQVAMREFQLNAPKYLDELPIVLTRYNEPIASVIPYKDIVTTEPEQPVKETPDSNLKIQKRCQAPGINCKNSGYSYRVTFYTDDGMKHKDLHLCGKHLRIAKDQAEKVEEL